MIATTPSEDNDESGFWKILDNIPIGGPIRRAQKSNRIVGDIFRIEIRLFSKIREIS
jgi:hypothetical protein